MDTNESTQTKPLPLRMIVEWIYCPRLFHYMHVEGSMVANEHVWRGRHAHEKIDAKGSSRARRDVKVDTPEEDAANDAPVEWQQARAIDLGDSALGIVAKLDGVLLDGAGTAIPTEMKSGSGPADDSPHVTLAKGVWDADAIHVAIQAMALEQAGYAVPHAELYYRKSRARSRVTLTPELRHAALDAIANARAAQHLAERPPPLVDSPKCKGCSLVEVCLPDESLVLRRGIAPEDGFADTNDDEPPPPAGPLAKARRLVASSMETRTVTVSTLGASVRKEGEALVVAPPPDADGKPQGKPLRIAMDSIDALVVMGAVQVSTAAIMGCLERSIPVSFHQAHGRLLGSVTTGLSSNVALRAAQHAWATDAGKTLSLSREIVRGKIKNQRVFLRRHGMLTDAMASEWESLGRTLNGAMTGDEVRGVEGRAARLYFDGLARLFRDRGGAAFEMDGRNRRPPRDPVNAMLSFGYAILTRECADVLRRVGFDPMRGFLHGMGWGRPALGLDLVEEFRVLIVDSTVLRVVAEKRVLADDFHRELQGVTMKPGARRAFLQALDQRREEEITHPVFGYRVTYRRAIELQARVLARVIEGETDRYVALTTR
ncbi:MAG: CRISPR-associated endonuclease Cas1 [Polyangiaceae bacterium]|nr:CRISPR-associated endonuclease Cas1 [Polyangiaceae bacterium]